MMDPRELEQELGGAVDAAELQPLLEVVHRLEAERPVPRPGFRAALGARLIARSRRTARPPQRIRMAIAAYAGSGLALLAVAALGLAGAGPLGY